MDMKKILQAMDSASTKTVEGTNDMAKFLRVVKGLDSNQLTLNEGTSPHKVTLPVQMAMQHYQQPSAKVKPRTRLIDKYFTEAEATILQKKQEEKLLLKQYAQVIAERVRLRENKTENYNPNMSPNPGFKPTAGPGIMSSEETTPNVKPAEPMIRGSGLDTAIVVDGIEIYSIDDLLLDLGIAAGIVALGTILAAPSGGSSAMAASAAIANPIRRIFAYVVKYAAHVAKKDTLTKEAISNWVKSRKSTFINLFKGQVAPAALASLVAGTALFNTAAGILEKHGLLPDILKTSKPIDPANPEASLQLK